MSLSVINPFVTMSQNSATSNAKRIDILHNFLNLSNKVKNLRVMFDTAFFFSDNIGAIYISCNYHLRDSARIHRIIIK